MKVLVLYTGGLPLTGEFSANLAGQTLKNYLELQLVAQVDIQILHHITGADVSYHLASDIGRTITEQYKSYDGFVVIHSIDNAIYTANLLAFQLSNLGKPIIFTGTTLSENFFNFPGNFSPAEQLAYREMSLRTSLVTSVQLATLNCRGVLLAYGPRIIQATHASENLVPDQNGFTAWPSGEVASVRFGIELNQHTPERLDTEPNFYPNYNRNIVIAQRQPDFAIPSLSDETAAVLLYGYQEQALPSYLDYPSHVLVVAVGNTVSRQRLPENVLLMPPLPLEMMQAKLMVGAARTQNWQELKTYMSTNQIGELRTTSV